jgi:hypothetical protein
MPPVNNPVKEKHHFNGWLIATIILILVTAALIALTVWLYFNYNEQKTNVDGKIEIAVSAAKKEQVNIDNIKRTESEKLPNRKFVGPDDYGRVTFDYPKTWSVYIDKDATNGGTYEAYLNPITVPPIVASQQYALRVVIEQKDSDKEIASFNSLVKKGDLKASSVTADGNNGTRLDGTFSKDIRGSMVIFKIRDKTLTVRTDAVTFAPDFNKLIATIKFNQ